MQSKQWEYPGSPLLRNFRGFIQQGMWASIFWDSQGAIMNDYLKQGRTINGEYYAGKLRRLRQEIARKRRGKLTHSVLLLQDNAPAHTSQVAMAAATECELQFLPHPQYSPDMAPSDSYLFPKLKSHLHGTQYGSNDGVIEAVNENLGDQGKGLLF